MCSSVVELNLVQLERCANPDTLQWTCQKSIQVLLMKRHNLPPGPGTVSTPGPAGATGRGGGGRRGRRRRRARRARMRRRGRGNNQPATVVPWPSSQYHLLHFYAPTKWPQVMGDLDVDICRTNLLASWLLSQPEILECTSITYVLSIDVLEGQLN